MFRDLHRRCMGSAQRPYGTRTSTINALPPFLFPFSIFPFFFPIPVPVFWPHAAPFPKGRYTRQEQRFPKNKHIAASGYLLQAAIRNPELCGTNCNALAPFLALFWRALRVYPLRGLHVFDETTWQKSSNRNSRFVDI